MLRGEFTDYKERDRRWNELRRSFAQAGIQLPDYPKDDTDLERLLVVGYSAKLGQGKPIGIGFETLAELGHHVHTVWTKDRKSVAEGKSVSVRVELGGSR